jgi:hypothetical protein
MDGLLQPTLAISPPAPRPVGLRMMLRRRGVGFRAQARAITAMLIQDTSAPCGPWETIVTYRYASGVAPNHVSVAALLRM